MKTLTKTNYEDIAKSFKNQVSVQQYRYAKHGSDKKTGKHTAEGYELYSFFKGLESIAFTVANNLNANENFDRDTFLKACGMQLGRGHYGGWSFVPNDEYIQHMK